MITIEIRVNVAWWVRWYVVGVLLTSRLTGLTPDMDKVGATIRQGITIRMQ